MMMVFLTLFLIILYFLKKYILFSLLGAGVGGHGGMQWQNLGCHWHERKCKEINSGRKWGFRSTNRNLSSSRTKHYSLEREKERERQIYVNSDPNNLTGAPIYVLFIVIELKLIHCMLISSQHLIYYLVLVVSIYTFFFYFF